MPREGYASAEYYLHQLFKVLSGQSLNEDIDGHSFQFDDESSALLGIDFVHHQVHEGRVFHASYNLAVIANNNSIDVQLTTGTRDVHLAYAAQMGGDAWVYLYEAPNTSGGTSLSLHNRNRQSNFSLQTTAVHTPSVTGVGTQLSVILVPGGSGPQAAGDAARSEVEWDLRASTKYLIRATNISGNNQAGCIHLDIYEL